MLISVLVLNLHFNLLNKDSNKQTLLYCRSNGNWVAGIMFGINVIQLESIVAQSTLNEASSGTQNFRGLYKSVSKTTDEWKTPGSSAVVATSNQ